MISNPIEAFDAIRGIHQMMGCASWETATKVYELELKRIEMMKIHPVFQLIELRRVLASMVISHDDPEAEKDGGYIKMSKGIVDMFIRSIDETMCNSGER